jgi:hypothetical protein
MKTLEIKDYGVPGASVGLIARSSLAGFTRDERRSPERATPGKAPALEPGAPQGALRRLGRWLVRRRRHGVEAELVRSTELFEALDRWLWKQHVRETEAWLAQSKDVFELEARMRRLERGPGRL